MTHFLDRPFAFSALAAPGLGPNGLMLCRCPGLRGGQPRTATPGSAAALEAEFPITDRTAPASGRQAEFDQLLDELLTDLAAGRRVAIHCQAGLGRTGLLAAGLLVRSGTGPDDAIAIVRSARPGSIETSGQEDFIRKIEFRGLE